VEETAMRWWISSIAALGALALASAVAAADIPCDPTGEAPPAALRAGGALSEAGVGVGGTKYWAPEAKRSEAGVSWTFSESLSILLNYERTSYGGRTLPRDEDNGVLTRLKVAF
jgi:hypothetical protein